MLFVAIYWLGYAFNWLSYCWLWLFHIHNNEHTGAAGPSVPTKQKAPKLARPLISSGSSEETWNLFKAGSQLTPADTTQQLFQCCDEALGNELLRGDPSIIANTIITAIKKLAAIPVAVSVRQSDLLPIRQCDGESVCLFFVRIKGKAAARMPLIIRKLLTKDMLISLILLQSAFLFLDL